LTPSGSDVAAVATPPATDAPNKNAAITLVDVLFILIGANKGRGTSAVRYVTAA
jgi:hypothetical protein